MYSYIAGKIAEVTPAYVVVDCGGVGYMINISINTYSQIKDLKDVKMFTHLMVREDAQQLFGFAEDKERKLFLHLISVSGVGAATARMILSSMNVEELSSVIANGEVMRLQSVKGIGTKSAQRIIVDLKDKIGKEDFGAMSLLPKTDGKVFEESLSALVMLGFARNAAEKALRTILKSNAALSSEELIKHALRML